MKTSVVYVLWSEGVKTQLQTCYMYFGLKQLLMNKAGDVQRSAAAQQIGNVLI